MPSLRRGASLGARVGITKLRPRATPSTAVTVEQPLRAESGDATFTYLAGLEDGAPAYDSETLSLAPEGRELELAVTHEAPIGLGRGAIEAAHAWNAGHEPGATNWRIGVAYRLQW